MCGGKAEPDSASTDKTPASSRSSNLQPQHSTWATPSSWVTWRGSPSTRIVVAAEVLQGRSTSAKKYKVRRGRSGGNNSALLPSNSWSVPVTVYVDLSPSKLALTFGRTRPAVHPSPHLSVAFGVKYRSFSIILPGVP